MPGGPLSIVRIVAGNAIPVVGVWFLGWGPLAPIFFYWLDGLLALWGLGLVALVVTSRGPRRPLGRPGPATGPTWAAAAGLLLAVLAVPSVVPALMVAGSLRLGVGRILGEVFASPGAWVSLALAVVIQAGEVAGELRAQPDRTLRETGEARASLFLHRSLAVGLLALWAGRTPPPPWALGTFVLVVATLFTFTQLAPGRYLRLTGFRRPRPRG
jgi:hypothetical protein